jgi:hypothetical protein
MAAHPVTGIDPAVDRFAIYDTSISEYTHKTAVWPVADGGPIVGGNPNRLWYKRQSTPQPEHDHRWSLDSEWNNVDTDPTPPEGHPRGVYLESHTLVKRPIETLKAQVETAFQAEVRKQFPDTENPSTLLLAAKALAKKQTGAVLTTEEQAILDAVTSTGDRVTQLMAAKVAFDAAIDADADYDLSIWPQV